MDVSHSHNQSASTSLTIPDAASGHPRRNGRGPPSFVLEQLPPYTPNPNLDTDPFILESPPAYDDDKSDDEDIDVDHHHQPQGAATTSANATQFQRLCSCFRFSSQSTAHQKRTKLIRLWRALEFFVLSYLMFDILFNAILIVATAFPALAYGSPSMLAVMLPAFYEASSWLGRVMVASRREMGSRVHLVLWWMRFAIDFGTLFGAHLRGATSLFTMSTVRVVLTFGVLGIRPFYPQLFACSSDPRSSTLTSCDTSSPDIVDAYQIFVVILNIQAVCGVLMTTHVLLLPYRPTLRRNSTTSIRASGTRSRTTVLTPIDASQIEALPLEERNAPSSRFTALPLSNRPSIPV